jgi:hypothetical protein
MASTRNKNTRGNYCLEEIANAHSRTYTIYKNSGCNEAYNTQLPGNGLNPAQIPWNKLSYNAVDIESFLFGVNSTNLVEPKAPCLTPELKVLSSANIYENEPTYVPEPLVVENNQRPFPVP